MISEVGSEPDQAAKIDGAAARRTLNEEFARVAKAVAHPKRMEMLDLISQVERSVEELAALTSTGVSNTSAHLQVLRRANLVSSRREGTRVFYRLADDGVLGFLASLRDLAARQLPEVERITRTHFEARDALEPLAREQLLARAEAGEVLVVDVRPREEYEAGHIPHAVSIPLAELPGRIAELDEDVEVVAYCRGPYCVLASEAVDLLRHSGRRARRLQDGWPEWRRAGMPVAGGLGR